MRERLLALVSAETGMQAVSADLEVEKLGVDSLEFAALMMSVAEEFWIIPVENWGRIKTVGDIERELEYSKP